jgi:hypothetical protein
MKYDSNCSIKLVRKPCLLLLVICFIYTLLTVEVNAKMDTPVLGFRACMKQAMGDNKKVEDCRYAKKQFQLCVRNAKAAGRKQKMKQCREDLTSQTEAGR